MAEDTTPEPETTPESEPVYEDAKAASDAASEQVQSAVDEINDRGYLGDKVDEAPNEDYTVAGVVKNTKS